MIDNPTAPGSTLARSRTAKIAANVTTQVPMNSNLIPNLKDRSNEITEQNREERIGLMGYKGNQLNINN